MFEPRVARAGAPGFVLLAHRGAPALRAENTVPSFVAAWHAGADVLELDLRQSADGELVVLHDASLERTTHGRGHVSQHSWTELCGLRCIEPPGAKLGPEGPARLARLSDVLRAVPDAPLNIDFKAVNERGVRAAVAALAAARKHKSGPWQVVLTSADATTQRHIAAAHPEHNFWRGLGKREVLALLVRAQLGLPPKEAWRNCALQVPLSIRVGGREVRVARPRVLAYAARLGCKVHVWNERDGAFVDTPAQARALQREGIGGLFTDRIGELHQALSSTDS